VGRHRGEREAASPFSCEYERPFHDVIHLLDECPRGDKRFRNEDCAGSQIIASGRYSRPYHDGPYARPIFSDAAGQLQPIHATGHVHGRDEHLYAGMPLQHDQRLICAGSLKDPIPGLGEHGSPDASRERLIVYDENEGAERQNELRLIQLNNSTIGIERVRLARCEGLQWLARSTARVIDVTQ
jgi:hypothetical protein